VLFAVAELLVHYGTVTSPADLLRGFASGQSWKLSLLGHSRRAGFSSRSMTYSAVTNAVVEVSTYGTSLNQQHQNTEGKYGVNC